MRLTLENHPQNISAGIASLASKPDESEVTQCCANEKSCGPASGVLEPSSAYNPILCGRNEGARTDNLANLGPEKVSFHRRKLPEPPATAFNSPNGRAMFQEALGDGMWYSEINNTVHHVVGGYCPACGPTHGAS
jgi:hypothetical protein